MSHAAVVLAAGASRRLGRPKQALCRDGEPLLRRSARLAADSGALRTVVVLGAGAADLRAQLHGLPVEILLNPDWAEGLGASLRCAARALDGFAGDWLVLGCDQPALQAAHLARLLEGAQQAASGCAATVHDDAPDSAPSPRPLPPRSARLGSPALIAAALWPQAAQFQGDRGFGAMLSAHSAGAVWRLHAPELALDLDTPADVAEAIARGWVDAEPMPRPSP